MDVGPDGSLCRLTSSFNSEACNVKIVKVSGEEPDSVDYKLVLIDEIKSDNESVSEKSDEELLFTLESLDIELGISKPEKAKSETKEVTAEKSFDKKNNRNKPFNRKFRPNKANRHRKNYFSPGQRNFNPYNNGNKSYNRQTTKADSNDINPWIDPPLILKQRENYQYQNFPQYVQVPVPVPVPVLDSSLNRSINSNMDPPPNKRGRGILGNSPMDRLRPEFQMANNFSNEPNYWDEEYSNNYQHPPQNGPMSFGKPPFKKHNNQNFWKNRSNSYDRNHNNNRKRRGRGRGFYQQQQ